MDNPFKANCYGGVQSYHLVAEDRIRVVKSFDLAQCEAALQVEGLQKTVERAIRTRMRLLRKAGALNTPFPNPCDGMTVVLEDRGQDFLEFDIYGGRIVATRPFQGDVWNGFEVLNETIAPGDYIGLCSQYISGVRTINYPVIAVRPIQTEEKA